MLKLIPATAVLVLVYVALLNIFRGPALSTNDIVAILLISLASAAASAGAIEVAERLFFFRSLYQEAALRQWLRSGLQADLNTHGEASHDRRTPKVDPTTIAAAMAQFHALAGIRGSSDRELVPWRVRLYRADAITELFDLPTEQLTAQLADAADRALSQPERYPEFSAGVGMGALRDLPNVRNEFDSLGGRGAKAPRRGAFAQSMPDQIELRRAELRETQVRVAAATLKRVQAFQIVTSRGWRRTLSATTVFICAVISVTICAVTIGTGYAVVLLLGLTLCPPIAWFIRDVAAGVERWRNG